VRGVGLHGHLRGGQPRSCAAPGVVDGVRKGDETSRSRSLYFPLGTRLVRHDSTSSPTGAPGLRGPQPARLKGARGAASERPFCHKVYLGKLVVFYIRKIGGPRNWRGQTTRRVTMDARQTRAKHGPSTGQARAKRRAKRRAKHGPRDVPKDVARARDRRDPEAD